MVGMPHMVTKGPEFSVLDHRYSLKGGGADRIALLTHLENTNNKVSDEGTLATTHLDGLTDLGLGGTGADRSKNLDEKWFGYEDTTPQDPKGQQTPTGWWRHWRGDAEGIVRETLIRAIRLSLGMTRTEAIDIANVRYDPPISISFRWCCGAPTFEGYIEWNTGPIDPSILVTFSTPANDSKIWLNFDAADQAVTNHKYDFEIDTPKGCSKAVWLVAHKTTYGIWGTTGIGVPVEGELNLTPPFWWLSGGMKSSVFSDIVTTRIPEERGGIDVPPRTWKAP